MSIINSAFESVVNLINGYNLFSRITRGALGTGTGLVCEIGPSGADSVYLDKNQYLNLDFTINGKHKNLQTLSDDMNMIHQHLTMLREYPSGNDWEIEDITTLTEPQIISREDDNSWVMASSLNVKVTTKL